MQKERQKSMTYAGLEPAIFGESPGETENQRVTITPARQAILVEIQTKHIDILLILWTVQPMGSDILSCVSKEPHV